ncbi:LysR family transcriptional regulator [Sphingomicrobium lutaoense]|uniref:DNA-binding transcriptional LysR family regulator n=1 Tax=Sphingomicrobium lutaoense TaxID=515949 RepID=A0A839Z032_9SPHN|nr:LysR family transcriptional regulator [Sphingomicrobium lutaoense]MBB3764719.1 DNA-binding transcriptional LysR family regulator [Sphingomicrobium lutaoense]
MFDWDDLRFFLAVARSGSTLAASRALRVSQATVSRRVTAFEERVGATLFDRGPSGYSLTPRGQALVEEAERVEDSVRRLEDRLDADNRHLAGEVRLTTVESAASAWIIPALARLREKHPDIAVDLITSDAYLDIASGEADVAIRFGDRPDDPRLIARHLVEMEECLYAVRDMVVHLGRPTGAADLSRYPLIVSSHPRERFERWIADNIPEPKIAHRINTLSGELAAVRAGLGAAMLPCLMGDAVKGLVRLLPPIESLRTPCWMVTTDRARKQPPVRVVIDTVVDEIQRQTAPPESAAARSHKHQRKRAARH